MTRRSTSSIECAVLALGIALYRRWLSGRGPLRRVACTFEHTETCSAHGLRVALGSRSLPRALASIRGRLERCRTASLYRIDGHVISGRFYDEHETASGLDEALAAAGESTETRAALVRAWAATRRARGLRATDALRVLETLGPGDALWPRIRTRSALVGNVRKALAAAAVGVAMLATMGALVAWCLGWSPWAAPAVFLVPAAFGAQRVVRRAVRDVDRADDLVAAARFELPATARAPLPELGQRDRGGRRPASLSA